MSGHQEENSEITSDQSFEAMSLVFDHYLNHHKAVFKKLHHARDATQQSYEELEALTGDLRENPDPPEPLTQAHAHDAMWGSILDIFKDYGATEDELDAIDTILTDIPRQIKAYYDNLVEQDQVLKELISKLHTAEYKQALSMIREVQSRPNPVTGEVEKKPAISIDLNDMMKPTAFRYDAPKSND